MHETGSYNPNLNDVSLVSREPLEPRRKVSKLTASIAAIGLALSGLTSRDAIPSESDFIERPSSSSGIVYDQSSQPRANESHLLVEDFFSLNGSVDDLAWVGGCLLAIEDGNLYRFYPENQDPDRVAMQTESTRSWVQLVSGSSFGLAAEGDSSWPLDRVRRPANKEQLHVVQCKDNDSLKILSSFSTDAREYAIGGIVDDQKVYFVEADHRPQSFGEISGVGCCAFPTLVAESWALETKRDGEVGLSTVPPYTHNGDRYWEPGIGFATEKNLIAVGGRDHPYGADRNWYHDRQIVVVSTNEEGMKILTRIEGVGGRPMEFKNGDLYVAAEHDEIRRYKFNEDGEAKLHQSIIAPGWVGDMEVWGDSLVAVVRIGPTLEESHGTVFEVSEDENNLTLRQLADFPWQSTNMQAEAWGNMMVLNPSSNESMVVMERSLPTKVYVPSVGTER